MPWVNVEDLSARTPPSRRETLEVLDYLARRAKPRFYADENFPAAAVAILRGMGARVTTVQEVGRRRHPDENHAAYALCNGLILATCDRDFLNEARFPLINCPAIFVFDFGNGNAREILQAFRCLGTVFRGPQFYDKWSKIDAHRDSWVEHSRFQDGSTARTRYRFWRGRIQEWVS